MNNALWTLFLITGLDRIGL